MSELVGARPDERASGCAARRASTCAAGRASESVRGPTSERVCAWPGARPFRILYPHKSRKVNGKSGLCGRPSWANAIKYIYIYPRPSRTPKYHFTGIRRSYHSIHLIQIRKIFHQIPAERT